MANTNFIGSLKWVPVIRRVGIWVMARVAKPHMDTELHVKAFFQMLFLKRKIQRLQVLLVSMSSA